MKLLPASALLGVLSLFSLFVSCPCSAAAPTPVESRAVPAPCEGYEDLLFCGDLNDDCTVSAGDALIGLRMAVGSIPDVPEADMDGQDGASASDALKILRIAVGSLPGTYDCDPEHVVLDAVYSGTYSDTGAHGVGNYAVGWFASGGIELRNYFVFDLSQVNATITAARFRADTTPKGFTLYRSSDPSETYELVSVSTDIDVLRTGGGGLAAFEDLKAGLFYGGVVVTAATIKQLTEVQLNMSCIVRLNEADGLFPLGGRFVFLAKGETNENIFNSTNATLRRQLVLTVAPSE